MNKSANLSLSFKPLAPSQKELIHQWLAQEHIKKWIHGKGLQNTLNGIEKFFKGQSDGQYWIAYKQDIPFGFLITSEISKDPADKDELAKWCQENGKAITLDLFICDPQHLGKGLSVPMIHQFLTSQIPVVSEVFIDPEKTNERAVHVYKKAGFKIIGEFIAPWHPVPHYRMHLNMKELIK